MRSSLKFQIPLIGLLRRPKILLFSLIAIYILTRISFFTHIDFPYRDDIDKNPTPQRHFITVEYTFLYNRRIFYAKNNELPFFHFVLKIQHTVRTLYDYHGRVTYSDSGYWFREADRNTEKTIDSLVAPETPVRHEDNPICNVAPFCGLPFYSCRQLHTGYNNCA